LYQGKKTVDLTTRKEEERKSGGRGKCAGLEMKNRFRWRNTPVIKGERKQRSTRRRGFLSDASQKISERKKKKNLLVKGGTLHQKGKRESSLVPMAKKPNRKNPFWRKR